MNFGLKVSYTPPLATVTNILRIKKISCVEVNRPPPYMTELDPRSHDQGMTDSGKLSGLKFAFSKKWALGTNVPSAEVVPEFNFRGTNFRESNFRESKIIFQNFYLSRSID